MPRKMLAMTLCEESRTLCISYPERDLSVLGKPLLPEGERFIIAAGVYKNYSLAKGQQTEAWSDRPVPELLAASQSLLAAITRDQDLLEQDYSYRFPCTRHWVKGRQGGFTINGRQAHINARRPGQIYIQLMEVGDDGVGQFTNVIDLRRTLRCKTDSGAEIVARGKRAPIMWPQNLRQLIAFLEDCASPHVRARHHYA